MNRDVKTTQGSLSKKAVFTKDERSLIERLMPRQRKIMEMHLDGFSGKAIGVELGVEQNTICAVIRSPVFKAEIVRRTEDRSRRADEERDKEDLDSRERARDRLNRVADKAVKKTVEIMEDGPPSIALQASRDILNRALGKTDEGLAGQINVGSITIETAQLIQIAMKESDSIERS